MPRLDICCLTRRGRDGWTGNMAQTRVGQESSHSIRYENYEREKKKNANVGKFATILSTFDISWLERRNLIGTGIDSSTSIGTLQWVTLPTYLRLQFELPGIAWLFRPNDGNEQLLVHSVTFGNLTQISSELVSFKNYLLNLRMLYDAWNIDLYHWKQ